MPLTKQPLAGPAIKFSQGQLIDNEIELVTILRQELIKYKEAIIKKIGEEQYHNLEDLSFLNQDGVCAHLTKMDC